MSDLHEIVVIGAGAAGATTAESLRRQGYDGRLTLVGAEPHPPYDRPPLSKQILTGHWEPDRIRLRAPEAYERLAIDLRLGSTVTGLDRTGRTVHLADGTRLHTDAVVVATGVRPRRLPRTDHPGRSEAPAGVHVLRTLDDTLALREALRAGPRLVVAGAGLLGTEAAVAARALGADVTLVSSAPVPLLDLLGPQAAGLVAATHRDLGLRVHQGRVTAVRAARDTVTGVQLADGSVLPADVVLVATGSVPNTEWLHGSGVPVGDGVVCDVLCAAEPGVWAAGDVANRPDPRTRRRRRLEHRTHATEQAMAVARNILAGAAARPFAPLRSFWTDQHDLRIQVFGDLTGTDRCHILQGAPSERQFTAVYCSGERVLGAVAVNMPREALRLRTAVETGELPTTDHRADPTPAGATET
ncbi:pyridine nucleotide-disulfide oxidoreductase [Streptomyces sp. NBRC 14336]|uniref:NAD(P)/FAD-dependent oxidoreductase n=1 Tax=Streptomyces sp. NBRC 14336 TaxID=3030992 RepID=UPI0024A1C053|nr:pyridine nucleotide-disulfide oxidoreductase [Streptomyces sp. NBRC 14336]